MDRGQSQRRTDRAQEESTEGVSTSSFISPEATGVGSGQYDVFLSFRGLDTRNTFTDHLYHSLIKAGTVPFCVFRDENNISIGEKFGLEILNAIARSKISIPIISENYASSKWCLRELIHIMDRKKSVSHIVLPIFYKVAPKDVRHLKGNFGNAFHSSREHFDEKDIQEGQRALNEVSYLNGWESQKIADGHEGKLVECVVETIMSKLWEDFQLDVPEQLVGLDDHMKEIMNWINNPSTNARMIGIYGMGGIGKTTLAKCIYNQLSNKFGCVSFLPDVRETTRRHGITYLQSQLISDILQSKSQVSRIDDGISIIKSRFKGKKVLILLDDIDDKSQLDALARERHWFMAGSVIIVTTRNEAVLDQSKFEVDRKYELNELGNVQALLLFNRHAFRMDHSLREFEGISRDIISNMGGLPLALQVVGSYLYKKTNQKVWEDVREQLKNEPHKDVQKILRISYDALEDGHKHIFLDIVCFFIGIESKFAMYLWEDYGLYPSRGIEELKLRCLIKIGYYDTFEMHDQLRDLGMIIFCQGQPLEKRCRPWDYNYTGVPKVLRSDEMRRLGWFNKILWRHLSCFRFRDNLRAASSGTSDSELLPEVRWFQWIGGLSDLSFSMHLSNLMVLDLYGSPDREDWQGWRSFMASKQLKVLKLRYCSNFRCTPDLSAFTKLKILILWGCEKLEHLCPSIGKLTSLVSLNLHDCWSLKELPEELGELKDLEELLLHRSGIIEIPTSIGYLRNLKKLIVTFCSSLREIPNSIGDLQNLQHLDLRCSRIKKLPSEIGDLPSLKDHDLSTFIPLKILILQGCYELEHLHPSIGKLTSLVHLDLRFCQRLKQLPEEVGELKDLEELLLSHAGITEIPTSIAYLRKLKKLSAAFCSSLREIPSSIGDLQNLQHLDLSCSGIEKLPSEIGDLPSLEDLDLDYTPISDLPESIRNLSSLQSLSLWGCNELRSLPELPSSLQNLYVRGCDKLQSLLELCPGLTDLLEPPIARTPSFSSMPST